MDAANNEPMRRLARAVEFHQSPDPAEIHQSFARRSPNKARYIHVSRRCLD
jgi:hypothetical protein